MAAAAAQTKVQYSAIVLGATGNVGGRIVQLLIKNPLCKKVVVVTRRKTDAFADPKASDGDCPGLDDEGPLPRTAPAREVGPRRPGRDAKPLTNEERPARRRKRLDA